MLSGGTEGMPLKPPSSRCRYGIRAGGGVNQLEQDHRHGQRDDADIGVADAAVEHEVAEQRREDRRGDDREQTGTCCRPG